MDLLVLILLSVGLYYIAKQNGISPWRWIINYTASFFGIMLVVSFGVVLKFGVEFLKSPELPKTALMMTPLILLLEVVLFMYFRGSMLRYIDRLDKLDEEDNNTPAPPPPPSNKKAEEKDFSYFR